MFTKSLTGRLGVTSRTPSPSLDGWLGHGPSTVGDGTKKRCAIRNGDAPQRPTRITTSMKRSAGGSLGPVVLPSVTSLPLGPQQRLPLLRVLPQVRSTFSSGATLSLNPPIGLWSARGGRVGGGSGSGGGFHAGFGVLGRAGSGLGLGLGWWRWGVCWGCRSPGRAFI